MFQRDEIFHLLLLGIVILFANSEADNSYDNWEITCYFDSPSVICTTTDKKLPSKDVPRIPLDNISEPEKVQTITIDLRTPRKGICMIDDHTMFHRFINLFDITFIGKVTISQRYTDQQSRTKLINQLFDLDKLEGVILENWKLGDNYTWKFPSNITGLRLVGHDYTTIDLSSYPKLRMVRLNNNKLKNFPKFSTPPPSIELLDLTGNPDMEVTTRNIAEWCSLEVFLVNVASQITPNEKAKYCECKTLRKFLSEFRIVGALDLNCYSQLDCSNSDLETFKSNHRKTCSNDTSKASTTGGVTDLKNIWIILVLTVFVLYSLVLTIFEIYDYFRK